MRLPTVAICYDFDLTLSPGNMQEFGFFDDIGLTPEEFWSSQDQFANINKADKMLANMLAMVQECQKNGNPLTKQMLQNYGKKVELFEGVDTWFERINEFGLSQGVNVEHYILSSNLKEMIEGTSIAKYFKKIYACSYIYDENGVAVWPGLAVNYTNKTQFLFRINKGCLDETDDKVNEIMSHEDRVVPFENIIYIGDSETDIPCLRLVMKNGGKAIGVYSNNEKKKNYLKQLLTNNKINFMAEANYSKGKGLETLVKEIIKSNKLNHNLKELSRALKKV